MAKILKAIAEKKVKPTRLLNIRVNDEDLKAIRAKAEEYAGGNVSAYIKHACKNFIASKKDLVEKRG